MATKKIYVKINFAEVMYDVFNKAHLTGRTMVSAQDASAEFASNLQASDDDSDSYQIKRSLNNALESLQSVLSYYIDRQQTAVTNLLDEKIDDADSSTIVFTVPTNFDFAVTDSIAKNMHAYLVASALAEWFGITNKTESEQYGTMAVTNLALIREALNKRVRPTADLI